MYNQETTLRIVQFFKCFEVCFFITFLDLAGRLRFVTVTVGLTESDVSTPCGFFAGPGTASQLVVIDCPTLPQGRFVKISAKTEYLTLCEVDVFGFSVQLLLFLMFKLKRYRISLYFCASSYFSFLIWLSQSLCYKS